jgi:hypothetical protein
MSLFQLLREIASFKHIIMICPDGHMLVHIEHEDGRIDRYAAWQTGLVEVLS